MNVSISTEVAGNLINEIAGNTFDRQVRASWEYIYYKTYDKFYDYHQLALWVAEDTKSIVRKISDQEYHFNYVGV